MAIKFGVPKFITIEDRLAGIFTFRQLFSLLGAFLLSFFVFKANQVAGLIVGVLSFGSVFLLMFVNVNGKPFVFIMPSVLDFFFKSRKFVWQRIEKIAYKQVIIPEFAEFKEKIPTFTKKEDLIMKDKLPLEINYSEVVPNVKEKLTISLNEPIAKQAEEISKIVHRHLINPRNPYRFFPYVKFYRSS